MSDFIEVKTAELNGAALDYITLLSAGWQECRPWDGQLQRPAGDGEFEYCLAGVQSDYHPGIKRYELSPSTNWAHGGPLIQQYQINLEWDGVDGKAFWWRATHQDIVQFQLGDTPLIAACRAIVASVLGETVSVPRELLP